MKGLNQHLPTTPNLRWGLSLCMLSLSGLFHIVFLPCESVLNVSSSCFDSLANCCGARVKSLWVRSHPIRRVDISQGTTLTTQTPQYMPTRKSSWSTKCWRSLLFPRRRTNSTWRSATARHQSDPISPRSCFTVQYSFTLCGYFTQGTIQVIELHVFTVELRYFHKQ